MAALPFHKDLRGRDQTLDIAKGLAIMLVVAGHTLQTRLAADFDQSIWFCAIYAFHMPLFVFLSGAVAGLKRPAALTAGLTDQGRAEAAMQAIGRSAMRLLIPFAAWTVIMWAVNMRDRYSFTDWLVAVCQSTDHSLWFLLTIFQCLALWQLWHLGLGVAIAYLRRNKLDYLAECLQNPFVSLGLCYFVVVGWHDGSAPSAFGLYMLMQYFGYFLLGALYHILPRLRGVARLLPWAVFLALIPFWHRTHPGPLSDALTPFITVGQSDRALHMVLACSGILMVLDIVAMIRHADIPWLDRALVFCGTASLGVYAIHFYIIGYAPSFIAPLGGSLLAYAALARIPLVRLLLLGERGTKIWLPSFSRTVKFAN